MLRHAQTPVPSTAWSPGASSGLWPSLLPRRLDAATTSATAPTAKPRIARAGTVSGYEYVREAKSKRALDVVVVPTTQGIATIACESEVVAPGEC